jgi:DNA-binding NarL/FixJ family response regulator
VGRADQARDPGAATRGRGLRNAEITADSIAEGTVKIHHNIYEKLGLKNRVELVLCARERGLV